MADKTEQQPAGWMAEQIRAYDAGELEQKKVDRLDATCPDWRGAWSRFMCGAEISDEQIWEVLLDASRRYGAGQLASGEVERVDGFFRTTSWRTPEAIAQAAITC